MSHWIMLPVIIPALAAPLIVIAARFDPLVQRVFSAAATVATLAAAILLWSTAADGPPQAYYLGDWPAPFGIVLVLDRLAATMLLLTAVLAVGVLLYAIGGWDRRGRHFHALFQFQLMGINGAFLTGDVFNLFVFFEVLLIASYGLMLHGAGRDRLRFGLHYVAVNLTGSTLFLFALGLVYATTGTLNMADLAVEVPLASGRDQALLATGGFLLFAVFAIKAALVPFHFWLPGTYAAASAPVAAFFAIMTKVGGYGILRVYTLIFGAEGGALAGLAEPWLLPSALVTVAVGMTGVLAARTLRDQACFAVIGSMGTALVAIGLFDDEGTAVALYYVVHSTVASAALFLVVGLIAERRRGDGIEPRPIASDADLLAGLFFLAAIAMAGLPPLSGFVGKLLVLDAARDHAQAPWIWGVILVTSLLAIVGFGRSGSVVFWKSSALAAAARASDPVRSDTGSRPAEPELKRPATPLVAASVMVAATLALSLAAGPMMRGFEATALQLRDVGAYVGAVLEAGPVGVPDADPSAGEKGER